MKDPGNNIKFLSNFLENYAEISSFRSPKLNIQMLRKILIVRNVISTSNIYTPSLISISSNGFSHKFVRVSTFLAASVRRAFLNPDFTNDPEDCICLQKFMIYPAWHQLSHCRARCLSQSTSNFWRVPILALFRNKNFLYFYWLRCPVVEKDLYGYLEHVEQDNYSLPRGYWLKVFFDL